MGKNKLSGKIPFLATILVVLIATSGIAWTHNNSSAGYLFWISLSSFILISIIWTKQNITFFKTMPKLGYAGLSLTLLAIAMFLFSGILERGYDQATRLYGVTGKIDQHVGNTNTPVTSNLSAPVNMLIHVSKMPLKIINQSDMQIIRFGSDFDVYFVVKNPTNSTIECRALLSVVPSTAAPLIQARNNRYPIIQLAPYETKTIVLKLHLNKDTSRYHNHELTLGVSLFNTRN